ncbi:MAG TPA: hypothetical protein ENK09_09545 [Nitrospirae bacterium]|nr:hypothetical protein [Nitrospirota bacterium]
MNKIVSTSRYLFILLLASLLAPNISASREITLMELEEVTDLIMSPGCNYIYTLTNCPSAEAAQMREIVKDKLQRGESKEQILSYFEEVYGPRVLAQPKKKGFYFVAWWFPYFLIIDIFVLIGIILFLWQKKGRRRSAVASDSTAPVAEDKDAERLLEEELKRFRE